MNTLARVLTLTAPLLASGLAQAAPPTPTDATILLAQMRQAAGGDAWSAIHTIHTNVTLQEGGQTTSSERWEDATTGRYAVHTTHPAFASAHGFDGITPWRMARSGIAYTLGDRDALLVAADESFRVARAWWFASRHPATIAAAGTRTEAGSTYDILGITPEGGRPFEAWIDHTTHLLARTDEQQAEDRVVTTYGDYRPVQGALLPHQIRIGDGTDPSYDDVETIQSIDINQPTPDTTYAIPPAPPSGIELPPGHDSVDIPIRLTSDNRIIVPLRVNDGATLQAEFDSGGSLILQPATLASLGVQATGHSMQGGGGEGVTTATNGRVTTVSLGDATIHDLAFHSFPFAPDQPNRALVGLEILQRFVVRFDFDRQVMTLTRPSAFTYGGHGAVLPFHFQDNQPEIRASIDGIAGVFPIDTGDGGGLLLIAPFARQYGLANRYQANTPYAGRAVSATRGAYTSRRVHTVAFDGPDGRPITLAHDPITRVSFQTAGFDASRTVSGNIGLGILKQFNLTFDYTRQRLILEPNHLYGQREIFNRSGLRLARTPSGWTVTLTYPNSPATDAHIAPGQLITRIDNQTPAQLDDDTLWRKLTAPVGTKLTIETAQHPTTLTLHESGI